MDDRKDESVIELTDVVEEAPAPAAGRWMETTPPPRERRPAEPAGGKKENFLQPGADLKGIPDSPLKKFILAEEEPLPPAPPGEGKPQSSPAPVQAPPGPPDPARAAAAPPQGSSPPVPEPAAGLSRPPLPVEPLPPAAPPPPRGAAEGSLPALETEMRALREAMLARVEAWVSREGAGVLEKIAREMFPPVAERIIRQEIEKMKAAAEEKE